MPNITPIQNSFAAGEISPLMYGRSDTNAYQSGTKTLLNMFPDSRGPMVSRFGMEHIYRISGPDNAKGLGTVTTDGTSFALAFTDTQVHVFQVSSLSSAPSILATPYPDADLNDLYFAISPDGNTIYIFHPSYQTRKMVYSGGSWSISAVTFTSKPAAWTGTNWPTCGAFFQGRLWAGGAPDQPSTFWASKSDSYEDFTTGTTEADAFNRTIAYRGKILWMEGVKNMLIGTTTAEHIITADGPVIWNEDASINRQSAYGSKEIQPIQVGDQILYISPGGVKVRAMQYEFSADNWLSNDLTFVSEHITEGGIIDIAWAQNPSNLLWAVLADGKFISATYDRSNNIFGWARHDTDGQVKAIFNAEFAGISHSFALTQRVSGSIDLELMLSRNQAFDSWLLQDFGSDVSTVTGLTHLEGKTVQVVVDGYIHPDRTVTGGEITLQSPGQVVSVGLPYTSQFKSLDLEQSSQSGSIRAYKKHRDKIYVLVNDSYKPLINGTRPPTRNPSTPMGTGESAEDGIISATPLGWSESAEIDVQQDLPLKLTILGIFSDVGVNTL